MGCDFTQGFERQIVLLTVPWLNQSMRGVPNGECKSSPGDPHGGYQSLMSLVELCNQCTGSRGISGLGWSLEKHWPKKGAFVEKVM